MAIDLIIAPLSKYWSGDYITPVMQAAWDMGAQGSTRNFRGKGTETELPSDC